MTDRNDDRDMTDRGIDNELRGKADQLKGRVKDAAGGLMNDGSLQAEGKWDKAKGKAREKFGEAQQDLGRYTDRVRDRDDDDL
jgi:uncharacterized protein YjbJ (UPF0337 family)